ncbi:MAG: rod-binding protein [Nitrospirae bacterium]|nr:rod-binding protein [Nitrospirota bacterium]
MDGLSLEQINLSNLNTVHKDKKADIKKVAKEMESLFVYQLLKEMRETTKGISDEENNSLGNDTYMSLFDMEVSKALANKGFGIQDAIMKWLERMPDTAKATEEIKK